MNCEGCTISTARCNKGTEYSNNKIVLCKDDKNKSLYETEYSFINDVYSDTKDNVLALFVNDHRTTLTVSLTVTLTLTRLKYLLVLVLLCSISLRPVSVSGFVPHSLPVLLLHTNTNTNTNTEIEIDHHNNNNNNSNNNHNHLHTNLQGKTTKGFLISADRRSKRYGLFAIPANAVDRPSEESHHDDEDNNQSQDKPSSHPPPSCRSHITTIRCQNIAGMVNYSANHDNDAQLNEHSDQRRRTGQHDLSRNDADEIEIYLGNNPSLVAVTGETGSGKSLLVSKVINFVMGATKGSQLLVPSTQDYSFATGELSLTLSEPHISHTRATLTEMGLNSNLLLQTNKDTDTPQPTIQLILRRTTERLTPTSPKSTTKKPRIRNTCQINGQDVTLKTLRSIATPLIATVDAPAAALALGRPHTRLSIVDSWVPPTVTERVVAARDGYRAAREWREGLEEELERRVLPPSFSIVDGGLGNGDGDGDGDGDAGPLRHWIEELDGFEGRVDKFLDGVVSSRGVMALVGESPPCGDGGRDASLVGALRRVSSCRWEDDGADDGSGGAVESGSLYAFFVDVRDGIRSLDDRLVAARSSCEALASLAESDSVRFALERSRSLLFDATISSSVTSMGAATTSATHDDDGNSSTNDNDDADNNYSAHVDPVVNAAERSHELLNNIEQALDKATRFMEDHPSGLISTLSNQRRAIDSAFTLDDIDTLLTDWYSLSRKHAVPSSSLPSCHRSLRQELTGDVEARRLLPQANKAEADALRHFQLECDALTNARKLVCDRMTQRVTARLPSLGMDTTSFHVDIQRTPRRCTDHSAYGNGSTLGLDSIEFLLSHGTDTTDPLLPPSERTGRWGALDTVGSAGEKARILLAVETEFPGSVGTSFSRVGAGAGAGAGAEGYRGNCPPVAVVYDEIDAHVGGRAAVAVADLMAEQTREGGDGGWGRRGQVISITHSPSVAAIADRHVMVQKIPLVDGGSGSGSSIGQDGYKGGKVAVSVRCVDGIARRKELARMASGDLASEEAELFADALLRDGSRRKNLLH